MKTQSKSTVLCIANATTLVAGIVNQICGNEIANTLNGEIVSKPAMAEMVASQIHANFSTFTKQGVAS